MSQFCFIKFREHRKDDVFNEHIKEIDATSMHSMKQRSFFHIQKLEQSTRPGLHKCEIFVGCEAGESLNSTIINQFHQQLRQKNLK